MALATRPRAAAGDLKGTEHPGWLYAATDSGEKGLVPENYLERQVLGASRKRAAAPSPVMLQRLSVIKSPARRTHPWGPLSVQRDIVP